MKKSSFDVTIWKLNAAGSTSPQLTRGFPEEAAFSSSRHSKYGSLTTDPVASSERMKQSQHISKQPEDLAADPPSAWVTITADL